MPTSSFLYAFYKTLYSIRSPPFHRKMSRNLICRTCLQMNKGFVNIFTHREDNMSLSQMLQECIALEIEEKDGLPLYICYSCKEKLMTTWRFRTTAIDSYTKLRTARLKYISTNGRVVPNSLESPELMEVNDLKIMSGNEEVNIEMEDIHPSQNNICTSELEERNLLEDENQIKLPTINSNPASFDCEENNDVNVPDFPELSDLNDDNLGYNKNVIPEEIDISKIKDIRKLSRKEKLKLTIFCKECNRSFGYKYYCEEHIRRHRGDTPFKCNSCDKSFVKRYQLNIHSRVHTGERPYSCEICGKAFKFSSAIQTHRFVHSEARPFKCQICEKAFKNEFTLGIHVRTHKKEKTCTCEICGKSFSDVTTLNCHRTTHVTEAEKAFVCSKCNKAFASKCRLKEHFKRHLGLKPHACTECDKQFKDRSVLRLHMLIHTGEKPYTCNICQKKFRHPSTLYLHKRTHTGETPYSCDVCPATFMYTHHLKNHKKNHK